eukprot:CAMPEP_0114134624 /NCGR_PEP_ID=MMETSP0043_2-20121206/14272_1 /TAXON_ID=464988 /ORGANISM="Hemiselmis andersenii, Strain CCMP644" /LENGTH=132 /DNA_ID=CAMNT_0001228307 /DNA_START=141 /DNA_END=535 /DNA_ORIENTATION=-
MPLPALPRRACVRVHVVADALGQAVLAKSPGAVLVAAREHPTSPHLDMLAEMAILVVLARLRRLPPPHREHARQGLRVAPPHAAKGGVGGLGGDVVHLAMLHVHAHERPHLHRASVSVLPNNVSLVSPQPPP